MESSQVDTLSSRHSEGPDRLTDVSAQLPLRTYLKDIVRRRGFLNALTSTGLREENMDTVLGNLWYLLNPLILIGIYWLVFGPVGLNTSRGLENFLTYLAFGVFVFRYTQQAVMAGAKSLVTNRGLIQSVRFPRAILPLSGVAQESIAIIPALGVAIVVALLTGEVPTPLWLLVIPALFLQLVFTTGVALMAARATHLFRDIQQVIPFVFRILFYLSGVIYSVERFVESGFARSLFLFNPMYVLLTLIRWPIVPEDNPMSPAIVISAVTWTVVALVGGFWYFRRGEKDYGRQ